MNSSGISRRGALTGASLGVTLPVLAACGDDGPDTAGDSASPTGRASDAESPDPPASSETPGEASTKGDKAPKGDGGIAATADVPVGGGLVLAEQKLVITQPIKGDFKGFTAVCTHQGCLVDDVTDTINCPCHGSAFSIEDGSVVGGPAPSPLAEEKLVVEGGSIDLA